MTASCDQTFCPIFLTIKMSLKRICFKQKSMSRTHVNAKKGMQLIAKMFSNRLSTSSARNEPSHPVPFFKVFNKTEYVR